MEVDKVKNGSGAGSADLGASNEMVPVILALQNSFAHMKLCHDGVVDLTQFVGKISVLFVHTLSYSIVMDRAGLLLTVVRLHAQFHHFPTIDTITSSANRAAGPEQEHPAGPAGVQQAVPRQDRVRQPHHHRPQ